MIKKELVINGVNQKSISLDISMPNQGTRFPVVIFIHGFKGFKDWGAWHLVADHFVKSGFAFLKFNFSHNGTSPNSLKEFNDLDAFYQNNLSLELEDVKLVLTWLSTNENTNTIPFNYSGIHLIGHSRGGGVALITALENTIVKSVALWAAVSDYHRYIAGWDVEKWKEDGEITIINGRTKQEMKMGIQFYEVLQNNYDKFNIKKVCSSLRKPVFIAHAEDDPAVSIDQAYELAQWSDNSKSMILNNGGHTFGQSHPYLRKEMPEELAQVTLATKDFFLA